MTQTRNQTPATIAAALRESARWADYGNDGYDRAASGRYFGYQAAAKAVEAQGLTEEVAASLEADANRAAGANDLAGYAEYNPFHVGQADALRKAAATIRKAL